MTAVAAMITPPSKVIAVFVHLRLYENSAHSARCGPRCPDRRTALRPPPFVRDPQTRWSAPTPRRRSEEHTSELQSQSNLVCRLLLEKKKRVLNAVGFAVPSLQYTE